MSSPMLERILGAFPAGTFAITAFLRVLKIEESEEVPTAAIENTECPRLLINPAFVDQWAKSPEKLFMLVMHELHHMLLGHTRLLPRCTPLDNIVFDAVINSVLVRMFPGPAYTALFTDFYSDQRFPECLLRPPAGWTLGQTSLPMPPALAAPEFESARAVYRALYSNMGTTYADLYSILTKLAKPGDIELVALLGDHRNPAETGIDGGSITGDLLGDVVARWPASPNILGGRSLTSIMGGVRLKPVARADRRKLVDLILRIAGPTDPIHGFRKPHTVGASVLSPLPALDRRTVVLHTLGHDSLLHQAETTRKRRRPASEKVHIYVDVSGSVAGYRGFVYSAVLECREFVREPIHLFSTELVDVSLRGVRSGECKTTGGTNIVCVLNHMIANKVQRAVMITDGHVGKAPEELLAQVRGVQMGVALTPGNSNPLVLGDIVKERVQLEGV